MALIYFLSSRPDFHSGLQPTWDFVLRKIAHMIEYAILTGLLARSFIMSAVTPNSSMIFAILAAALYAVTDEYHQTFVPGRNGSFVDWLIDVVGISTATMFILNLHRSRTS